MTSGTEALDRFLKNREATRSEGCSWAAVADYIKNGNLIRHNAHRHNAQVDALFKAKCGDDYNPPTEEDMVSPTLINCHFNGDNAVKEIYAALSDVATEGSPPQEKPVEVVSIAPVTRPATAESIVNILPGPSVPKPPSPFKKLLGPALGIGLGAATALGAAAYFGGPDNVNQYDMIALPYQPVVNPVKLPEGPNR